MFLELRTKATIEEGIQWREKRDDGSEAVCYCPGDGTRYVVIVTPLVGFSEETRKNLGLGTQGEPVIVTLASDPGAARSLITHRGAFIAYDWIKPKLGTTLASSITLAEFLGWLLDGDAWSCDDARDHYAEEA